MLIPSMQEQFDRCLTPPVYRMAWNYACRLCATREDAEDLLQEALGRAFRSYGRLRHPERFCAWLISIIRNCFLTNRRRPVCRFEESCWHQHVMAGTTDDLLAETIAEALTRLPPAQREILSLFYLDGLSLEETGWVLDVAPQVVGQRLYRARRALRRVLSESRSLGILSQRCKSENRT